MKKIYSNIDKNKLLHIVIRLSEVQSGRMNVVPEEHFIQCSTLNLPKRTTFKAHKHVYKERTENKIAQESWVVIRGKVKCFFYDLDGTLLEEVILEEGDASFTLEGGHNYLIEDDNTIVYEYKTGPYEGQELDKVFIDVQN